MARRNRERRWADDWRAARQEAARPDADPNALAEIVAGSPDGDAVEAAAAHPNCPPAVVTLMAADPDATSSVRVGAARHPNLNDSMYDRLAGDPDPTVRAAVAANAAAAAATRAAAALTAG